MALRRPETSPYRLASVAPEDLDDIASIEREAFLVPWKREFFATELTEPFRYTRVLVRDDGIGPRVGGYLFAISLYEEFHINKIATDARLRGLGLGRDLLEDALARAHSIGAATITLEVRVSNVPARQFYRSYEFREAFRRKSYYQDGEDALALVLPLSTEP